MFIALTNAATGARVDVAVDHVMAVGQDLDGQTLVNVGGQAVAVSETPGQVLALIAAKTARASGGTRPDEIGL